MKTSWPSHMDFSHLKALQMRFNGNAQPYDAIFATYIMDAVTCHNDPSTQVLSPLTAHSVMSNT